ncbi:MAG TPA: ion transporter [Exilispira sp.]|nr:ion transporter [Spirochaetota bacterium]HNV43692.1 ion transporter [Exilispira sp.]HOV46835.1 ion transporter [Exilispira sp.]HQQ19756.1 ion transporter [Exilispira sp.]
MENKRSSGLSRVLNGFINILIFVSILQIILDDLSVVLMWDQKYKTYLFLAGFAIDCIFSIEFITRTIISIKNSSFANYFFYENGWIDFICSIPLLLFSSGPSFITYMTSGIILTNIFSSVKIMRIVRTIRISRILRILRVFKLLKNLQNANSKMLQNHLKTIMIICIFSIIISLFIYSYIPVFSVQNAVEARTQTYTSIFLAYSNQLLLAIDRKDNRAVDELVKNIRILCFADKNILKLEIKPDFINNNDIKVQNSIYKVKDYEDQILRSHYLDENISSFNLSYSVQDLANIQIGINLLCLFAVILASSAYILYYLKIFVTRISDVIYIIFKGIKHKDYYYQVKIPEHYKDEEIFEFAKFYNNVYLPAKKKMYKGKEKDSKITIDDLLNMDI